MPAGASGCGADPFSEQELATWYGFLKTAVGAELLLLHPDDPLGGAGIAVLIGGPLLYLIGEALFRWRMAAKFSTKRLLAVAVDRPARDPRARDLRPRALGRRGRGARRSRRLGVRRVERARMRDRHRPKGPSR